MIDFDAARETMIESQLMTSDVTDRRLLRALREVPREKFLPEQRRPIAYIDEEHVLRGGVDPRVLPTPASFAKLVQLAEIGPDDVVLDIACGTGYSSAVLASLASAVVAIEDDDALVTAAEDNLSALDIGNAAVLRADLPGGVPSEAPFDAIVIEGAVEEVPAALLDQLKDHGRLVALLGRGATAVAHLYVRSGDAVQASKSFNAAMPSLSAFSRKPEFSL